MWENNIENKGGDYIEIWKTINGYEGLYEISTKGRVYSYGGFKWIYVNNIPTNEPATTIETTS